MKIIPVFAVGLLAAIPAFAENPELKKSASLPDAVQSTTPMPAMRIAPLPAGEHWRLIFPDRIEAIEGAWARPAEIPANLRAAWYWSERVMPTRLRPEEIASFAPRPEKGFFVHRRTAAAPVAPGTEVPPATLIAAPTEMWREVPEKMLPHWRWPSEYREVRLPRTDGSNWQVRLLDGDNGTFWLTPPRSSRAANLAALPARSRTVRAVDAEGSALTGLAIDVLRSSDLERSNQGARSGPQALLALFIEKESDRLAIPSLPDSEPIVVVVKAPGYVPITWQGLAVGLPEQFRLEKGASVTGRLVDAEGHPIAGVEVLLESWLPGEYPTYLVRGADSEANGTFALGAVPVGAARLVTRSSRLASLAIDLEVPPRGLALGDLEIGPGQRVGLRILDDDGRRLAGALVATGSSTPQPADQDGHVMIAGVHPERPLELGITAEGYFPRDVKIYPPFQPSNDIRLAPAFVIEGVFLDEKGRPVPDGRMLASDGRRTLSLPFAGVGAFELTLPVDTSFELRLFSASGSEVRLALDRGRPGERRQLGELRAQPARKLTGRLVADDGSPVAGGRAWLPRPGATDEASAYYFGDLLEASSDAEGFFALLGLPAGAAQLRIDAPGYARKTVLVPTGEDRGEVDMGDIQLAAGAEIEVMADAVRDGAAARLDLGRRWLELDMLDTSVYGGVALFRQVPPGKARLTVVDRGKLLCEKELVVPESGRVTADCDRSNLRVAGTVTLGGRSSGAGRLTFASPVSETTQIIHRQATPGGLSNDRLEGVGRPPVEVAVDESGRFVTEDLMPGLWRVGWVTPAASFGGELEVELADLDEAVLQLDFPFFRVRGVVVDRAGNAVEGARVRETRRGLLARSGSGGVFEIEGLEAGESWLVAEKDGERSPSEVARVEPDGAAVEVVLRIGQEKSEGKVAVQVLLPDHGVAASALVFLETAEGTQQMVSADGNGVATFELERPYPSFLRVGAYAEGKLALGSFQRFAADMEPLELQLGGTGSLVLSGSSTSRPAIRNGEGWDISWWLGRLGRLPIVENGVELAIEGLPAGTYSGAVSGQAFHVEVEAGQVASVSGP